MALTNISDHKLDTPTLSITESSTGMSHPLDQDQITIGRGEQCTILIDDPFASRQQLVIEKKQLQYYLVPISTNNDIYLNGRRITSRCSIYEHDEIQFGNTSLRLTHTPSISQPTHQQLTFNDLKARSKILFGRAHEEVDLFLNHITVSRRHAQIVFRDQQLWIEDLNSSNGTYVNGYSITKPTKLSVDDRIDIGPFSFVIGKDSPISQPINRDRNCSLLASNISYEISTSVDSKIIVDDVSLVFYPGEFVGILGPSGSGKSTLLNILSARLAATQGTVKLNDLDLHSNFNALKEALAFIPQHDELYSELTVSENLRYTAELRLPSDLLAQDLETIIAETLASVELQDHANKKFKNLSGGQQKRASLANEIICQPSLLFLDEVTSGLDEATDRDTMELLKTLSRRGLLVLCVTHTLANVEENCDKIVIMANPGVLAFYGTPSEAKHYFGVSKIGDIYRELPKRTGKEWRQRFHQSTYYIPLPVNARTEQHEPVQTTPINVHEVIRQVTLLVHRNTHLLQKSKALISMAFGQSMIIGALLAMVFSTITAGHPSELSLIFLLGICSFWLGCNGAAKEIVKERIIYQRERNVKLSILAYLLAKFLVLSIFVTLQIFIFFASIQLLAYIPGDALLQAMQMVLAGITGTSLGLLISASCSSQEQANTLVPLALIPQIVLAGVIVPDMPPVPQKIAETLIGGYINFQGMKAVLASSLQTRELIHSILLQGSHVLLFLGISFFVMRLRDGKKQ